MAGGAWEWLKWTSLRGIDFTTKKMLKKKKKKDKTVLLLLLANEVSQLRRQRFVESTVGMKGKL